ncbi:DUF58 domain-containing protein [bacterium]|nr:DUF58 domain-containing protein [bacterium]
MKKWWNSIFLGNLFFILLAVSAILFVIGHFFPFYQTAASSLLLLTLLFTILDAIMLYYKKAIFAKRQIAPVLSNGDSNSCTLQVSSSYSFKTYATIYDEIPYQFNLRELKFDISLNSLKTRTLEYEILPSVRGEYQYGNIIVSVKSPLRLVNRRYEIEAVETVAVYPSFVNLQRYNLQNFRMFTSEYGIQKTRRIGHSTEFEQIKDYVKGDDIRHINWKASAKKNQLMVNQYTDEKAKQIFSVIDTGRAMEMPFNGLSLLDHAINASLALSQVIVKNQDRAGLVYFNKKVEKVLPADRSLSQVPRILNLLYNIKTEFFESNFEKLYAEIKFKINHRSLILLFTNFEDMNSLHRQMPYLKGIAKNNVLLLIFFKNSEIESVITETVESTHDYYYKAVSEKLAYQKRLMVKELNRHGIQTLLTSPEHLTSDTINKYLEIKAKAII